MTASELEAARLPGDAERLATIIVAAQLRALFADPQGECLHADAIAGLRPTYGRWLEASLRHLERHGLVTVDGPRCRFAAVEPLDALWRTWDESMVAWTGSEDHRAYLVLIDACLRHLSDILTGAVNATDVMFPESSMHLVEGIYKHNPIAAHFNRLLGEHLRAELSARAARGEHGLRLIEIGAGTGGTTATLLPMLRGFGDLVEEYCYTDLSKAFLLHAEETYQPGFPALRTAIFDVGKPLALQSVEGNRYDVAIATNVLHATSNMRETMRNAKALLKRGGIVLINELSEWSWFNHFTFGMLDGWWLSEDQALRLPGCPCLSPAQWEKLLKLEGFKEIRFPAHDDHGLGQQIVAARSDGLVRQRLVPSSAVVRPAAPAPVARRQAPMPAPAPAAAAATTAATVDDSALREACTTLFREMIGAALRMDPREIDPLRALEHYGLDSILVVQLTTRFRKLFPDVRSTLFFEVKSIDGLVRHFLDKDRAAVVAVLAERGLAGAAAPAVASPAAAPSKPAPRRMPPAASTAAPMTAAVAAAPAMATAPAAGVASVDAAHDGLREACATLFREMIGGALRMDPREIEAHRPLEQYGLDSILVVQLTTRFRKLFPDVRSTLFFEVQSVDGLVRHFLEKDRAAVASVLAERGRATGPATPAASAAAPVADAVHSQPRADRRRFAPRRPEPAPAPASVSAAMPVHAPAAPTDVAPAPGAVPFDVAIIGLSGRYPQSPDLERFWDNLSAGRSCIAEVPEDRWHWQDYYDPEKGKAGTTYSRWGGFIADIDKFDPLFFRIAPREAKKIDPQERLFLETSYHAIEDSGHTPQTLSPTGKVGVFVGVMNSRYTVQPLYYSIANRVSFLFDFSGPSFAVDSACSSSLTAIHLALDSLYGGLCDAAIAGGVSLIVDPQHMIELSALGMLSEGAACRSFGRNADGFVDAEGVGAVILKPLAQALRDGDHVHAVIKASALNAGGRTHGYTVPNPVAQAEVVSTALARAGVDSDDVSYLEAHGTGTALGDPIEVSGLTRAFRERARGDGAATGRHCAIGSLKSNIGHCESAAGIAGLTKILLQLRHRQLVPTLHAEVVNEEIDFERTPFRLQRALAAWQPPVAGGREIPRIAGISSFGAGGANAHLVVQEAPVRARPRTGDTGPWLVPLSARTAEQLQDRIAQLAAFLRREGAGLDLASLAYTLQVGREAMDERIVLQVDSLDDLRRRLQALADGQRVDPEPQRGNARKQREFLAACRADAGFAARRDGWLAARDLAPIAEHWAKGVEIDWTRLYGDVRPLRMPLPTYPFARERHWMAPQRTLGAGATAAPKHPLLQRNTSTLRHPAYGVELKGDERFLVADAAGRRRLPALLCLEMARAAIAEAYPDDLAARTLRFEAIALDDDLRIEPDCLLQVTLLPDSDDALRFEIHSVEGESERIHAQGLARFGDAEPVAQTDGERVPAQLAGGLGAEAFRARLATLGLGDRADVSAARRVAHTADEAVLE
ncbi:MAG: beta-ketoacyl synthase N-terminal-like domain-containing protein [Lysobacteraceae bacterium]